MEKRLIKLSFLAVFILIISNIFLSARPVIEISVVDSTILPDLRIFFSITDAEEKSVKGLKKDNIKVFLNDSSVDVKNLGSFFDSKDHLVISMLIDISGSMKGDKILNAQRAAFDFVERLSIDDRISLIVFNNQITTINELTNDKDSVIESIKSIAVNNDTALYDTIIYALEKLSDIKNPHKSIILLTDGKDTKSKTNLDDCMKFVNSSNIRIYTIGLGHEINRTILEEVAKASGGRFYYASNPESLMAIYNNISDKLTNQYYVTIPFKADPTQLTHNIKIEVWFDGSHYISNKIFSSNIDIVNANVPVHTLKSESLKKTEANSYSTSQSKANLHYKIILPAVAFIIGLVIGLWIGFSIKRKSKMTITYLVLFALVLGLFFATVVYFFTLLVV